MLKLSLGVDYVLKQCTAKMSLILFIVLASTIVSAIDAHPLNITDFPDIGSPFEEMVKPMSEATDLPKVLHRQKRGDPCFDGTWKGAVGGAVLAGVPGAYVGGQWGAFAGTLMFPGLGTAIGGAVGAFIGGLAAGATAAAGGAVTGAVSAAASSCL
ncbi:unnamed protein product [Bemisia tabaci]|uniref:Uncharacterized protein n=1 Tax=Bemisia tabaci TaxID=7038 RepID=A0A9P0F2I5_BEMTA|nr:unnamed protein product [Bemisia tabaci]